MKKKGILTQISVIGAISKSLIKILIQSNPRGVWPKMARPLAQLLILGNGPSLKELVDRPLDFFEPYDLICVNFFANSTEFQRLRPQYYLLCDPHFFLDENDANVGRLWDSLRGSDWGLTLFVPTVYIKRARQLCEDKIEVRGFNPVGIEGPKWFLKKMFDMRLGMPRPRNVLIPSIMVGVWLGYQRIYIAGADHSWMKTLRVNDQNEVVSVQPHFYEDNEEEHERVASVYRDVRLHEIVESFAIAFKNYFPIAEYATGKGIEIYNVTPGSFIDAFPRQQF